jgi:hypothetical protein
MPWLPELFTAPVMEQILDKRRVDALLAVPYFDGLLAGDPDPLVESFAGEPEVYLPERGRIKGVAPFRAFVTETNGWLRQHDVSVEDVAHVILDGHGFEEVVLHLDSHDGPVHLPVIVIADRQPDGRIDELRVYFSNEPLTGRHANRPPLLQPDPGLEVPDVVAAYLRAVAAGDVDAIVAAFEPDGCVRESGSGRHVHRGPDALRAFYGWLLSSGDMSLEACAVVDDGQVGALEHVVRWGSALPPQAAVTVFVRGESGRLAAVRVYDDIEPPQRPDA